MQPDLARQDLGWLEMAVDLQDYFHPKTHSRQHIKLLHEPIYTHEHPTIGDPANPNFVSSRSLEFLTSLKLTALRMEWRLLALSILATRM